VRYRVDFGNRAKRQLAFLQMDVRKQIDGKIQALGLDPRPPGHKKIVGHDLYRIRVGDYRVIYEIRDNVLVVLVIRIGHRREIYRDI
jgi:mRNA interferase RelE/StbE